MSMTHHQSIEILESGQIHSSTKSIGTILYINLFNHLSLSIRISGVVERCCISIDHCIPVRILGGNFGEWKPMSNRSMIFLWPSLEWQHSNDNHFCQVSLLLDPPNRKTHVKLVNIKVHYLPKQLQNNENLLQISSSPYYTYPKCNHFLNIRNNQCETLDHLRREFSHHFSSSFIPFNHRHLPTKCNHGTPSNGCICQKNYVSVPINQKLYHPQTYIYELCTHISKNENLNLNLLLITTACLSILYLVILIISSIFICNYHKRKEHDDKLDSLIKSKLIANQRFSLIEISSELQLKNNSNSCQVTKHLRFE